MSQLRFPATQRNRDPILEVLRPRLPAGRVLEIASGSGEHAVYFATALPHVEWQPSDLDSAHLASIEAWRAEARLPNLRAPLSLDTSGDWPEGPFAAIFCANMVHIAPWTAAVGLFSGAARMLAAGSPLITYGPYTFGGEHTSASNVDFDASLRSRDPAWGVRDVGALEAVAPAFELAETLAMPANNFCLVWRRT